ncbi:hypothetical protein H1R20_g10159, partial [Candolleomyces eurysporus]
MIIKLGQAVDVACPNLVELKVRAYPSDETVFDNFPIERVSIISLDSPLSPFFAIELMSRCLCASSIFLRIVGGKEPTDQRSLVKMPLPTLTSLNLCLHVDPVAVLQCFHLPALKNLEYELREPRSQHTIAKYLAKAEFKLTRLHITDKRPTIHLAHAVAHALQLHEVEEFRSECDDVPVSSQKVGVRDPWEVNDPPWLDWLDWLDWPKPDFISDVEFLTSGPWPPSHILF